MKTPLEIELSAIEKRARIARKLAAKNVCDPDIDEWVLDIANRLAVVQRIMLRDPGRREPRAGRTGA